MPEKKITPQGQYDPLCWIWTALVSGLTFLRWWQPAEGTMQGDTLCIALGWFVALALLGWIGCRGTSWKLHWDGLSGSIVLLTGGHLLASGIVLLTSGDQRATLNLMWEWLAIAVSLPLLRLILSSPEMRREWTVVALAVVVTLSVYGWYQRAYVYPQLIADYQKVRVELDVAEKLALQDSGDGQSFQLRSKIQTLQSKLIKQGLQPHMLTGSSRASFEGRLLHSTEALGRFALANTFAGLLLVWFVVLGLLTFESIRPALFSRQSHLEEHATLRTSATPSMSNMLRWGILCVCLLPIGSALLLTKSRTGILATLAALGIWWIQQRISIRPRLRTALIWLGISVAVLTGVVAVVGMSGGLDRLVFAEAPKSLQYRLEYWWSTLRVIGEAPLTGVGPGQFRQHYLVHKLPQSSEEIADPHNLILDVWANGGIIAFLGLGWLILILIQRLLDTTVLKSMSQDLSATQHPVARLPSKENSVSRETPKISSPSAPRTGADERKGIEDLTTVLAELRGVFSPIRIGAVIGLLALWFLSGGDDTSLLVFAVCWAIGMAVFDFALAPDISYSSCWAVAACGLAIHLLGAGGIAMPAINQLLICLIVLRSTQIAMNRHPSTTDNFVKAIVKQEHSTKSDSQGVLPGVSFSSLPDSGTEFPIPADKSNGRRWALRQNRVFQISGWSSSIAIMLAGSLFAGAFVTGAQPNWLRTIALDQAEATASPQKREQLLHQAVAADSWSSEPWERLAANAFQKWQSAQRPDDRDFQHAVQAQQSAIDRNPLAYHGYRVLGEFYAARTRQTQSAEDRQRMVAAFQAAIARYPHHAELNAVAAANYLAAGEKDLAVETAKRALRQDDINHAASHTDKYLPGPLRIQMEQLASTFDKSNPSEM